MNHLYTVVASEVKQSVLEHAAVAGGENEAVAVEPVGVLGVVPHYLVVQDVAHRGASHGKTRVTRVRLLYGIYGQEPDRVDGLFHQRSIGGLIYGGGLGNGSSDGAPRADETTAAALEDSSGWL